jgi:hypothetical protein
MKLIRCCLVAALGAVTSVGPASAVPVVIGNPSFESDVNSSATGAFGSGNQAAISSILTDWAIIATDNTSDNNQEVAVGWANLTPAEGTQALSLMAGAAVSQQTATPWSSLSVGDTLTLTIAAGDRSTGATATPRWADESFFGLSAGLAGKTGTPGATGWITNVVARSPAVTTPPGGYKAGTMGNLTLAYTVTASDLARSGNVGVFIASLGSRNDATNGAAAGANQSFWDHVRLDLATTPGPTINSFTTDTTLVNVGGTATLSWDVAGATSVSISPTPGTVAASGSTPVSPLTTTTYTLTATNDGGSKTRTLTISVIGPAVYRYFRFVPVTLRGGQTMVQLAEFQMLVNGTRLAGATATNPGGSNSPSAGEGAGKGNDNDLGSKWLDANKQPLVLDFGTAVAATGYRIATANDAQERDPVSWRVEGSQNGTTWALVDEQSNVFPTTQRNTWLAPFATLGNTSYPSAPGAPAITGFGIAPATIAEGDSATLAWAVTGADQVLLVGYGPVAATGSLTITPPVSTGYSLLASNSSGTAVAATAITVDPLPRGQIQASSADAEFRTAFDGTLLEGPVDPTSSILDVGRQTDEDRLRHLVIPFQLPNLGSGGFRRAELTVFTFTGGAGQQSRTPINLFAIPGARVSASPVGSDVVDGGDNALNRGYRIMSGYLNATTPFEDYTSSGPYTAAADGLGYWLNEAYANGANAGKYVFLRLSPAALEIASGLGFGLSTGDSTEQFAPTLFYTFNPAGVAGLPVVSDFSVTPVFLEAGSSGMLAWSVLGASSVSISPGLGTVATSGTVAVSPAATTAYTLTATNASGTRTATATQTVVPPGAYRYFRFTTLAVRGDDTQALNLGELEILRGGAVIPGATASSSGTGMSFGSTSNLVDGQPSTNWTDLGKAPITLDYGSQVVADAYRFAVSGMASWDPVSWKLEASRDGMSWTLLDEQSRFPVPAAPRDARIAAITLLDPPPLPAAFRITGIALVENGSKLELVWNSEAGAHYTIETSTALLPGSWAGLVTGVVSQGAVTTQRVPRDAAPKRYYRIVRE